MAGKLAWMRCDGKIDALGIAFSWYRSVGGQVGATKLVDSTDSTLETVPEVVSWGSNWRGGAAEM